MVKIKALWLSISVTVVNLLPYLLLIGLIQRTQTAVVNVLPFALFYTLRRTWPFFMRSVKQTVPANTLIFYGLAVAAGGLLIGSFGQLAPILWDISGILIGISAAILPAVYRWQKQADQLSKRSHQALWQALGTLSVLLVVSTTVHHWPAVAFLAMAVFPTIGLISAFCQIGWPKWPTQPNGRKISPAEFVLFAGLTGSLLLVRLGRNTGRGQYLMLAELGLLLLFVALAMLVAYRQVNHQFKISRLLQLQMLLAGQLTDYIAVFSVLYLSILYGLRAYSGVIVIYILAALLAHPVVNYCQRLFNGQPPYIVNLSGQLFGLLVMLLPYGYYLGVFIVRVFNSGNFQLIDQAIAALPTEVVPARMYFRTRLTSIGGIFFQLMLFGILGFQSRLTGQSLNAILGAYAFQHPTARFQTTLTVTQLIVTLILILTILGLIRLIKQQKLRVK